MTRYDGLQYGRKIREFSSKEQAVSWRDRCKTVGKMGKFKGKKICQVIHCCIRGS